MNPVEFAVKNRLISFIVILIALFGGWRAYSDMPRFEDPEFTIREAVVITQYPGATPTEVANEVTEALESAIQQLPEVEEIRSVSSAGVSRINVAIRYDASKTREELQGVWAKLRNKVGDAQRMLPPGVQESIVDDDFGDVYGLYYLLTGPGFSPRELEDYAKTLRTDLLAVDGVAKVTLQGAQGEAIYVEISRERAAALGVSVQQVYADLAAQNSVASAGAVEIGDRRVVIHPSDDIDTVEALGNIIVSTPDSATVVYLQDVADIRRDYRDPTSFIGRYNGVEAIGIGVSNTRGANVVEIGHEIEQVLENGVSLRPVGMEVHEFYNQAKVVNEAIGAFLINVVTALVIVLVTLLIFMGLRSALVIGAVLVLTIAATLATMYQFGIPMHRISLGALIIALGMLVDNAIVVTDGILVGVRQGRKKLEIARDVVARTKWPLLGGTLVGILAFAPIAFAPGQAAEYTNHLFWVVMISLLFSWVFAITLAPLMADLLFAEPGDAAEPHPAPENTYALKYRAFLKAVLSAKWVLVGVVAVLFAASLIGFNFVKSGFFPNSTTPQMAVDYWLPEGTKISRTNADVMEIERFISGLDGVEDVNAVVGQGALRYMLIYPPEPPNPAFGQILIRVDDYRSVDRLIPEIQRHIDANYPDAMASAWRFQLGPGGGSKIEAEFAGPDPVVLRQLANQAQALMAADGGLMAVKDDWRQPVSVVEPIYSASRGRRLGVSREDLAAVLETNTSGRPVGVFREQDRLIPIVARAPEAERRGVDEMAAIQVPSRETGRTVPLVETVDGFRTVWRNAQMRRVDRVWTIKAQANPLPGELASTALDRIRPQIEAIDLPDGYELNWRGEYGNSQEANQNLASTVPAGLAAMVLVVVLLFNAVRQPLIIWLIVPLALIGVVVGLLVMQVPLEFMAILGLLSLSGLLIKNAIVLVDQMDLEIAEGKPRYDAVIDSAMSRVRPVMMGSLTTILGVMPLLADAFFQSMAVVLVFGLTFATLLTLVVVPALYTIVFRVRPDETSELQGEPA